MRIYVKTIAYSKEEEHQHDAHCHQVAPKIPALELANKFGWCHTLIICCKDNANEWYVKTKKTFFGFAYMAHWTKRLYTTKAAKKQSVSLLPLRFFVANRITFRGARQKQLTSCDHDDGGKPIRGGRSLSTFSHGNHVCSHGDGCGAEMFFSFYSWLFDVMFCVTAGGTCLLGCKITHNFPIDKE